MRAHSPTVRSTWAVLFAILVGLRLLSPAGFMPAFDQGAVTIVACPDADGGMAMVHHHPGDRHSAQPCPYAAAAALGGLAAGDGVAVLPEPVTRSPLPSMPALPIPARYRRNERPPLRGPPLPA